MEIRVAMAVPPPSPPSMDFNFDSNCSSPYIKAPSSPQRFGTFFFSAPSTPSRHSSVSSASSSSVSQPINNNNQDFEFDFGRNLQRPSLSAEELFHGGKIRPLTSPSSSKRHPLEDETTTRKRVSERTRNRASSFSISKSETISVSQRGNSNINNTKKNSEITSIKGNYRKWRLKDFLLFRSASEGRAIEKDSLRKYAALSKTTEYEEVRNSSFRSTESCGSASRRRRAVSAHELHYTENRAVSEEMKKKTMLPYKQQGTLLGCCLGFNPEIEMHRHVSRRIPSSSLERS